jgi:hypothetical protein
MTNLEGVSRGSLERALEQVRTDVADLHRDLAGAERNRKRWIFLILWLLVADVLQHAWFEPWRALAVSATVVSAYSVVDGLWIRVRAFQTLRKPHPSERTRVDLS